MVAGAARSRGRRATDLVIVGLDRFPGVGGRSLERWLAQVLEAVAPESESFGVRLCGDRAMRAINRDFRGRDEVTDVLSFPGDTAWSPGHLGDVLLCVPQARRQAAERGESLARELRTLLLHGLLHCQGYDHETDDGEMDRIERRLRRRFLDHG